MTGKVQRPLLAAIITASLLGLTACDELREWTASTSLPGCDSQREVAGWNVTTGLARTDSSKLVSSKWKASRDFSTFFGIRIVQDTSKGPAPYLEVWHDYKAGTFIMHLGDGARLSAELDGNFAVTTARLREIDAVTLGARPVRIEHISHDSNWKVYQTTGLPDAIAAAKEDLGLARKKLEGKECAAQR